MKLFCEARRGEGARHRAAPLTPDKQTLIFPLPSGVMGTEGRTFKALVLKRPNNLTPSDSTACSTITTRGHDDAGVGIRCDLSSWRDLLMFHISAPVEHPRSEE